MRKQLGIDKHLVLLINPQSPPQPQVLLEQLYAFANQPAQTTSINLHSLAEQKTQARRTKLVSQENTRTYVDPKTRATIEQLSERELLNVFQQVKKYFSEQPLAPPERAYQQEVQNKIETLQEAIDKMKEQRWELLQNLENLPKNPLKMLNNAYDKTFSQLERTIASIDRANADKQRYQEQLQQWQKLGELRSSWLDNPRTQKMQQIAAAFNLPHIREKLERVKVQSQQVEASEPHLERGKQRGRGLSL